MARWCGKQRFRKGHSKCCDLNRCRAISSEENFQFQVKMSQKLLISFSLCAYRILTFLSIVSFRRSFHSFHSWKNTTSRTHTVPIARADHFFALDSRDEVWKVRVDGVGADFGLCGVLFRLFLEFQYRYILSWEQIQSKFLFLPDSPFSSKTKEEITKISIFFW